MKTVKNLLIPLLAGLLMAACVPGRLQAQQLVKMNTGHEYHVNIISQTPDSLTFRLISNPELILTVPSNQVASIRNIAPKVYDKAFLQKKLDKYRTTAICGGILAAAGIGGTFAMKQQKESVENADDVFGYMALTTLSVGATLAGTALAIIGTINTFRYKSMMKKVEIDVQPAITGATVRIRF